MINSTELNNHDNYTHDNHDNIVKTVDLREDTTNTLEPVSYTHLRAHET